MSRLKYQEIKDWLREEARKPESTVRMPTVREIMRRFCVSLAPVNRALQELEQDGLIRRRQGAGIVACAGNAQGSVRQTPTTSAGTVIFAYPAYHSELLWKMAYLFEQSAQQHNLALRHYVVNRGEHFAHLAEVIRTGENLRGVIVTTGSERLSQEIITRLATLNIPVVIADSLFIYDLPANMYMLSPDMYSRGQATIDYLVGKGHRRIGIIRNEPLDDCFEQYKKGIRDRLKYHGLAIRPDYFLSTAIKSWDNSADAAQAVTRDRLAFIRSEEITALTYYSTAGAFASVQLLSDAGIRVPDEISVIGGADYWYAGYATPALTVATCDYYRLMADSFAVAAGLTTDWPQATWYDAQIIERKSVKSIEQLVLA